MMTFTILQIVSLMTPCPALGGVLCTGYNEDDDDDIFIDCIFLSNNKSNVER